MRIGIPVSVVLSIAAAVVVTTLLDPLRLLKKLPIDIGNVVVSGTKITMQAPRIAGFSRQGRPYLVTANTATQDLTNPNTIELQEIHAKIGADDDRIEITARAGSYDNKAERLQMRQDIVVISTAYEAYMSEATVGIHSGDVVSEKPVHVKMTTGVLDGNRMEIAESGNVIRFQNGVTMTLDAAENLLGADDRRGAR